MYLLVFITLLIAMIGVYAQVIGVQTARMMSHQNGVAQAMLQWHATAVALAEYAVNPGINFGGAGGCSLTYTGSSSMAPTPAYCTTPAGTNIYIGTTAGLTNCAVTSPQNKVPCLNTLPSGYNSTTYTFNSVAYQVPGPPPQSYVITYVVPPTPSTSNPGPGLISLPSPTAANAVQIGLTMGDLMQQMRHSGASPISYGEINAAGTTLVTNVSSAGTATSSSIEYPTPTTFGPAQAGAIAVISSPAPFLCPTNSLFNNALGVCVCSSGPYAGQEVPAGGC